MYNGFHVKLHVNKNKYASCMLKCFALLSAVVHFSVHNRFDVITCTFILLPFHHAKQKLLVYIFKATIS